MHLRENETLPALAAGFGVSTTIAWRYVGETLDVLAAWAPGLHEALTGLGEGDHVIIDGTLPPTDRIAADEPYHSETTSVVWSGISRSPCAGEVPSGKLRFRPVEHTVRRSVTEIELAVS